MARVAYNVLIAEDDFFVRAEVVRCLKILGHHVAGEASCGDEAVRLAGELCPDVILVDIEMPGMSGLAAARKIREQRPVPVVFLTAYDMDDFIEEAVSVGGCGYLLKPPNAGEIDRALSIAVCRHAEMMALRDSVARQAVGGKGVAEIYDCIDEKHGLISICCWCKKIRDKEMQWKSIEYLLKNLLGARMTHGICPDCMKEKYNLSLPGSADDS